MYKHRLVDWGKSLLTLGAVIALFETLISRADVLNNQSSLLLCSYFWILSIVPIAYAFRQKVEIYRLKSPKVVQVEEDEGQLECLLLEKCDWMTSRLFVVAILKSGNVEKTIAQSYVHHIQQDGRIQLRIMDFFGRDFTASQLRDRQKDLLFKPGALLK
ncbi:hypothetical protein HJ526_12610 [Donghicola sp. C2-DW-16]|uniref:Uncharacterized protein n=1 Tax=Donghicola mangrovi TaxID=2729614 RepID=A0ABX2PFN8_9RHOB|nr:hypothetical protein [Donghicola mangrovi]NVO28269.1 hypothetical protein [Donghicola mangrovi]